MCPPPDTFHAMFTDLAQRFGHAPALAPGLAGAVSFDDVRRIAGEVRSSLRRRGLAANDRVAAVVTQDMAGMLALAGSAAAMTTMPLREQIAPDEAEGLLRRAGIRALLAPESGAAGARAAAAALGVPVLQARWLPADVRLDIQGPPLGHPVPDDPPAPADVALLVVTSGTTGRPRIVPWSQSVLTSSVRLAIIDAGLGPGFKSVLTLPTAMAYGILEVFVAMACGALVIIPAQIAPSAIRDIVRSYEPDWLSLGSVQFAALVEAPLAPGERPLNLRWIASGGAALRPDLRLAAEQMFGCPVLDLYGSSESGPISRQPFPVEPLTGNVGRPLTAVRVADEDDADLPAGAAGRLLVKGPCVFPGYIDDPEATARAFTADGWLRTSDRGILHPDGSLSVLGRIDDLINRGGDKVDPAEVQAVLNAHPAVLESAVFAIAHPRYGSEPAALLVPRPGFDLSLRDLRRWLIGRLSPQKIPRRIAVVPDLPRTPTGKIRRAALAELFDGIPAADPPLAPGP